MYLNAKDDFKKKSAYSDAICTSDAKNVLIIKDTFIMNAEAPHKDEGVSSQITGIEKKTITTVFSHNLALFSTNASKHSCNSSNVNGVILYLILHLTFYLDNVISTETQIL